ncbi:acyl-CoA dehydrogenase family protein [Pseudonocardia sp. WMMC193]|uniref:acyl-CoA dehydrogenase family protein n=1 Tax=Pseudonocardia sp. WMMC193 TaxID=2911965 RepID=UPI001F3480B7|nr:acyl-CoA dehydrogenase family protein [Pseudonocardia sp. WMMC193]MCF7547558.1 hypothetical protein [Pseudonocardia sp. WMMC193]
MSGERPGGPPTARPCTHRQGIPHADPRRGPPSTADCGWAQPDLRTRCTRWSEGRAADHFDKTDGKDRELADITKVYASELSVQTVYDAMRLVGVDGYGDKTPIAGIMQDVLCFPVYDGGNMGVRRRALHEQLMEPSYDHLALAENRLSTGT